MLKNGFPHSNFILRALGETGVFICINLMIFKKWANEINLNNLEFHLLLSVTFYFILNYF